jgi:hypothetical protein
MVTLALDIAGLKSPLHGPLPQEDLASSHPENFAVSSGLPDLSFPAQEPLNTRKGDCLRQGHRARKPDELVRPGAGPGGWKFITLGKLLIPIGLTSHEYFLWAVHLPLAGTSDSFGAWRG